MLIAAIIKEFQLASELNEMKGIVPDDILEALKKKKLGLPGIDVEAPERRNALMAGEFEVIMELMAAFPEQCKMAKAQVKLMSCIVNNTLQFSTFMQVDKLIDIASPPPRGTGVQNLREIILENKMTYDVSSDEWQIYLKNKIMNNIERYFYMIVFSMYVREQGPKDFGKSFKAWMEEEHAELRYRNLQF